MSLPKPTLTTLGKLIPRLGSNHPGEVTATVAAICRTLHGAGADLHDLRDALGADWAPEWRNQVLFCRRALARNPHRQTARILAERIYADHPTCAVSPTQRHHCKP